MTDFVFPVMAGKLTDAAPITFEPSQIHGSAFSVGPNLLVTAAHVVRGIPKDSMIGLGFPDFARSRWSIVKVEETECHATLDVAVLRSNGAGPVAQPWTSERLPILTDVQSYGFPYALDGSKRMINVRAFKGHIVAIYPWAELSGRPVILELSFQVPRGLSGAPIFQPVGNRVVGMAVGNRTMEMPVLSSREIVSDGRELVVERFEALNLGIAIATYSLFSAEFKMLGGSIEAHLRKRGLYL